MTKEEILEMGKKKFLNSNVDCEKCVGCVACEKSVNCVNCKESADLASCVECVDCEKCVDCVGCAGQKNQRYMVADVQLTKTEYQDFMSR